MPARPGSGSSSDDRTRQNLFVEAEPAYHALISPPTESSSAMDTSAAGRPHRVRGQVMPVEASSMGRRSARPDGAQFTRRNRAFVRLRAFAGRKLRQADLEAGRVLRRLASRRYGALAAVTALGGLLVALTWLVLAVREVSTAHVAVEQRLAHVTVALRTDQARIDALSIKLGQATLAAEPPLAITTAARARRQTARDKPNPLPRPRGRY